MKIVSILTLTLGLGFILVNLAFTIALYSHVLKAVIK